MRSAEPQLSAMGGRSTLILAIALAVISIMLLAATSASATPTLTITVGSEPVESITTQLIVAGTDPSQSNSFVLTVKAAGGEACGSNPEADRGQTAINEDESFGEGPHTASTNWSFEAAGSYLLCAWLLDDHEAGDPVVATEKVTVDVRPPHLSLSISAPARVAPNQTFQITTTAQAETARSADEFLLPNTGHACPANASAAGDTSGSMEVDWPAQLDDWSVDGGPFSETANESLESVGSYLICAYFEYPNTASVPEATASATILVAKPLPACVVPRLPAGSSLSAAEHRIASAHCKVGRVRYLASSHHRRGTVISVSPSPESHHANGSAVSIVVSRGRPKRH